MGGREFCKCGRNLYPLEVANHNPRCESSEAQSESEKFFAHLNNGEVSLVPKYVATDMIGAFHVVINPKEVGD